MTQSQLHTNKVMQLGGYIPCSRNSIVEAVVQVEANHFVPVFDLFQKTAEYFDLLLGQCYFLHCCI